MTIPKNSHRSEDDEPIENNEPDEEEEPIEKTLLDLAKHITLISAAFLMIFGVAIGLDWFIRVLEEHGYVKSQTPVLWALIGAKYAILIADCSLLATLVYKYTIREIRRKR